MIRKYFLGSFIFTIISLALAAFVGFEYGGNAGALSFLISATILAVLEVSVSLDNAVVNATVLKDMDDKWRHRFLTWGMVVAVFGMRLVFPILIVSLAGGIGPIEALMVALKEPKRYEELLTSVHVQVMAFGGTFLFLVFASHFLDHEKEVHWVPGIGPLLSKIGKHGTAKLFIPITVVIIFSKFAGGNAFLIPALWGIVIYLMVDGLGELLGTPSAGSTVAANGLAGFMYLQVLDASFSFDGVIAAFAITDNFILIMLGLSIGAMFVRSLTIMMVEKGTLDELRYVEDGAFWGIGWLVFAMFASTVHVEIGEVWIAGGTAAFITAAAIHSIMTNKREKLAEIAESKNIS